MDSAGMHSPAPKFGLTLKRGCIEPNCLLPRVQAVQRTRLGLRRIANPPPGCVDGRACRFWHDLEQPSASHMPACPCHGSAAPLQRAPPRCMQCGKITSVRIGGNVDFYVGDTRKVKLSTSRGKPGSQCSPQPRAPMRRVSLFSPARADDVPAQAVQFPQHDERHQPPEA